jgi:predicted DsbA family dithiol-disulfide isomerase
MHQGGVEKQNALMNVLFRNYFEEEKNIGDNAVLLQAAEEG